MNRSTKLNKENSVLTRRSRKAAAVDIAQEENVLPADVREITEIPLKKIRKPRTKRTPGKKKGDPGDGIREINIRYEKVLKEVFASCNTDRIYDRFSVDCHAAKGYYPGTMYITANLLAGGQSIYRIETYVLHYPDDVKDIAQSLFFEMYANGIEIADTLGL
jgi:hypothetical protein